MFLENVSLRRKLVFYKNYLNKFLFSLNFRKQLRVREVFQKRVRAYLYKFVKNLRLENMSRPGCQFKLGNIFNKQFLSSLILTQTNFATTYIQKTLQKCIDPKKYKIGMHYTNKVRLKYWHK